ncbi:MAG: heavy metal translocating P-type ATPase [bacterium]|nr:heavy metal translocating P-type ATPase [bacterium]
MSCHEQPKKHTGHGGNNHTAMDHGGGHGMGCGSASGYLRRFYIVAILLIPLLFTNPAATGFLGVPMLPYAKWIGFIVATIIFGFALVFFQHAWHEIKSKQYGMMTLVSVAVGAGYLFSVASTFIVAIDTEFYLEISTLVWVLLFGHYLEAKSGAAAGDALMEVGKLLPKQAHVIKNGNEHNVDIKDLVVGDIVLVKPGEKIPADGVVESGSSNVDEAHISGESKPVAKGIDSEVVAGAVCLDGSLTIKLTRVGENSTIGQIRHLISAAQKTKPRSQRIADVASRVLVAVALSVALSTLLIWTLLLGHTFVFGMTLAITVLVIACPHALGLAIPTVTTIATSLAVKNGIFIKDLAKIETIRKADYVVFDKTGTLTSGEFGVTKITAFEQMSEEDVVQMAASLEQHSSHIIGQSIVRYAQKQKIHLIDPTDIKNAPGKGIEGLISGTRYYIGNVSFVAEKIDMTEDIKNVLNRLTSAGNSTAILANESGVIGALSLSDEIKEESALAVESLHSLGVRVAMLTGDNETVAKEVAERLGIDTYFAQVQPADKYQYIKKLQDEGNVVLMVGDGVNDAPGLTQADVGVAIGTGTDVAVEAGDIVLLNSNPRAVARLVVLSRAVYSKMIQNLVWALGYNIVAIPVAAGAFAYWGLFLRPEIGALLMSLSTVIVVINALMLRQLDLSVN